MFASGSGTTAEAVIEASVRNKLDAEIVLVISNQKEPGVFERVARLNHEHNLDIKTATISTKNYPAAADETVEFGHQSRDEEAAILALLSEYQIDFVALLGYMKLVGGSIVSEYGYRNSMKTPFEARMVNTHPGILPATKGLYGIHIQEFVLENDKPAGHCLFAVDAEYDGGPVVAEHLVSTQPSDTPESLFERIKASERATIAEDINQFLTKKEKTI